MSKMGDAMIDLENLRREVLALRTDIAAANNLLRRCWIQCDTFKKPSMCWDMYHELEKWAEAAKKGENGSR